MELGSAGLVTTTQSSEPFFWSVTSPYSAFSFTHFKLTFFIEDAKRGHIPGFAILRFLSYAHFLESRLL